VDRFESASYSAALGWLFWFGDAMAFERARFYRLTDVALRAVRLARAGRLPVRARNLLAALAAVLALWLFDQGSALGRSSEHSSGSSSEKKFENKLPASKDSKDSTRRKDANHTKESRSKDQKKEARSKEHHEARKSALKGSVNAKREVKQPVRAGFVVPPPTEKRYVRNEVMLHLPSNLPAQTLDALARRYGLTRIQAQPSDLTGRTLYRWRINDGRSVTSVIRALENEPSIEGAQPNYEFSLQDQASPFSKTITGILGQYTINKLHLKEAHVIATGEKVLIALIDSGIDSLHPDLKGTVVDTFDAMGSPAKPDAHGTGMAGAIVSHAKLEGVAPRAQLLAVRAFGATGAGAKGTSFHILSGLEWAVARGARVINMSFAGPPDPTLQEAIANAYKKGVVFVAAAGNGGPNSPPLYPGADPNVIAATATDVDDQLFPLANRGNYIGLAAPGVDVVLPAPDGRYQLASGTSVAAAHVSGVVALLLECNPALSPDDIRKILATTANALAAKVREDGSSVGLVDARQALGSASPISIGQRASSSEDRQR
jgi:subtilisin family serine protease